MRSKELGSAVGNKKIKAIILEYKHTIQLCVDIFV